MLACLCFTLASVGETSVVFDPSGLGYDERCALEALQGLANREGPKLFLGSPDDPWLAIYGERNGIECEAETDLAALYRRFGGVLRGVALYDPERDGTRYVAVSLAGADGLLPVTEAMLAAGSPIAQLGLPVGEDLRGRFATSVEAYDWALREVMPRLSRKLALAADGRCDGVLTGMCGPFPGLDWQVRERGFVFNLASTAEPMASYGGTMVGGSAEQTACYRRILAALEPPAEINGYGEPEDTWCKMLSEHGHFSFHYGTNWSFHAAVPETRPLRQKLRVSPETTVPETERFTVCFLTSEGDTMKGPLPFFMGSWFDPDRGRVPMSWGINPLMAERFPAMLSYYYDTATPNDCFFAGCSGAGYAYPDFMPNVAQFARFTGEACRQADITCVDAWSMNKPEVQRIFAEESSVMGLSVNRGRAGLSFPLPGVPLVDEGLMYWQHGATSGTEYWRAFRDDAQRAKAVDWLVSRIEDIAATHRPPFVILVYADLHSYERHAMVHREAADRLDPTRFRAMRLDEAMAGLAAWGRDRIVIDCGGINAQPLWAALEGIPTELPVALVSGRATDATCQVSLESPAGRSELPVDVPAGARVEVPGLTVVPGEADASEVRLEVRTEGKVERLEASVPLVPSSGVAGVSGARLVGVWDAPSLTHSGGSILADPAAFLGRAWRSPEGKTESHIVFGPYAEAPEGPCVIAFRMKLLGEADSPTRTVATLDVNTGGYEGSNTSLGKRDVAAEELGPVGEWRWVLTELDWPGGLNRMETRVWWTAQAPIAVDRVAAFALHTR